MTTEFGKRSRKRRQLKEKRSFVIFKKLFYSQLPK